MKTLNLRPYTFIIAILFIVSCSSQRSGYSTWDNNRDNRIDREEFGSVFRDGDTYDNWDTNGDDRLDEDEWNTGFNVYSSSYPYDERGLFDEWDTERDDYIDRDEFSEGTFNLFDSDESDYLEGNEYENLEK